MLIQAFCLTRENVVSAVTMVTDHFRPDIDFYEISCMKVMKEGYYHIVPKETFSQAMDEVDQHFEPEKDNVAVYYNEGRKVYIRIYKNAKFDAKAYS